MKLDLDLDDPAAVPYFLWDEPMTAAQLRERLANASEPERDRLLGKILREARDPDVWRFTTPEEVQERWDRLSLHLGRRRAFWEFLFGQWRAEGQHDQGSGGCIAKVERDGIRIDPPEEILANKLCTLLSRAEIRDLVDLRALEASGLDALKALPRAMEKDGGLTSAQLAWVLSSIRIGADARPPGEVSAEELRLYLQDLVRRLTRIARPE